MADVSFTAAAPDASSRRAAPRGAAFDPIFQAVCAACATLLLAAIGGLLVSLLIGGWPALAKFGLGFVTSTTWDPVNDVYGGAGPIVGTLITAVLSLIFALPIAFGVAVFLTEFCPRAIRRPIGIAVELLAGVPSIVYGMWGLFVFAPLFANWVEIPAMSAAPSGSVWEKIFTGVPNGSGILAASIILAIMILPYMAATLRELFLTVPSKVRESAYGVGATPLEVVRAVTLPYVRRSAIGAVMLGLGRALGETMAVTFVIGNTHDYPNGLFSAGSTISSTIANEFAEAAPGLHTSALIALGLVLFVITFAVLAIARALLGSAKEG
ncbi:MAG: phosphate ABC transporter permease subunit PstC [Caulobacteraceae bacterium]|nr:phosphate ABC transporter permease subunit PstC [Caulobacter sp.]